MAKKTYTPAPVVPPEMALRYETMVLVLTRKLTVSEGARRLGLSRNHFQSPLHRAQAGLLEGPVPKAGGRPPVPEPERRLAKETERLRLEQARLRRRLETTDHLLNVASRLLRGRIGLRTRPERGTRRSGKTPG